jgi:spore maturation protein SpmA
LGILNIGEKAGAMNFLSRIVGPFLSRLFPEVPKKHPATGQMIMNFSANLLGLDNAATPLGLKAMNSLQELNPNKETASNAQIMFLVLHTSGLQLLPVTIIAQRFILHSNDPADVLIPCIIATYVATSSRDACGSYKAKNKPVRQGSPGLAWSGYDGFYHFGTCVLLYPHIWITSR